MKILAKMVAVIALFVPAIASADSWNVLAKVTMVEASHVPSIIYFKVDQSAGSCPAGAFLTWTPEGDTDVQRAANMQTVYATLLTAKLARQSVRIVGDIAGCRAYLMYVEG